MNEWMDGWMDGWMPSFICYDSQSALLAGITVKLEILIAPFTISEQLINLKSPLKQTNNEKHDKRLTKIMD